MTDFRVVSYMSGPSDCLQFKPTDTIRQFLSFQSVVALSRLNHRACFYTYFKIIRVHGAQFLSCSVRVEPVYQTREKPQYGIVCRTTQLCLNR